MITSWCSGCNPKDWWRTIPKNFLKRDPLVCDSSYTCAVTFKPVHRLASVLLFLAFAEFREASERRHIASSQAYRLDKNVPNRSPLKKRHSIYYRNPGPWRGKEDAFEKQIAGKWHVITLQEASEYVDHDILTNRFHVTHYGGCAILFNKHTIYSNIDVKSIYLHDTRGGFRKGCYHVPHFVDLHSAARNLLLLCLYKKAISTHKTGVLQKKAHPHNPCHHDWSTD